MDIYQAGLSVGRPYPIARADRVALAFDAQEAVTSASATVRRRGRETDVAGVVEAVNLVGTVATVTVVGTPLERGGTYELAVTFTDAANRRWTRTLDLVCVS